MTDLEHPPEGALSDVPEVDDVITRVFQLLQRRIQLERTSIIK